MQRITLTLIVHELLMLPADGVTRILDKAAPEEAFLKALHAHEADLDHGRNRWPIINHIRRMLAHPPKRPCAACDRGDYQLGHATSCPKA